LATTKRDQVPTSVSASEGAAADKKLGSTLAKLTADLSACGRSFAKNPRESGACGETNT
jgi:hypothetical protein